MAIDIKPIPVLRTKAAISFNQKADENIDKKFTVNFSEQISISDKILAKANYILICV